MSSETLTLMPQKLTGFCTGEGYLHLSNHDGSQIVSAYQDRRNEHNSIWWLCEEFLDGHGKRWTREQLPCVMNDFGFLQEVKQ